MRNIACFLFAILSMYGQASLNTAQADEAGVQFFNEQVEPLLKQHCYKCHGNGKYKGGLSLYAHETILSGGDSGPAIDAESLDASLILDAVNYESYEMPPNGKLPQGNIDVIAKWVKLGAPMPERTDVIEPHKDPEINDETRSHWSFVPIQQPSVPVVEGEWGENVVDAFVFSKLKERGLAPATKADKRNLIRRVHYDVLGLPPSPEDVEAFANDTDPKAYEKLVERLLASPHYGEHWARYWLDLVRYGESNSFERDNPKPFVWKYRDYVIKSLNDDKPYDQFLIEQLAGDEIEQVTPESIIATGYYRLGAWDDEPADPLLAEYDELDDIVATTSQGMLGLSMNCARCHDHKLDPLPTADYYSFVSFFRNVKRFGIRSDQSVYEHSVRSIATPEEAAAKAAEKAEYTAKVASLRAELDAVENRIKKHLVGGEKDDFKKDSVRLRIIRKYVGKHISKKEMQAYTQTRKAWTELRNHPPQSDAQALAVKEDGPTAKPTHILIRGNPQGVGDEVFPQFPQILTEATPVIQPPAHGESTGRRLALAKWIANAENPLTARVMVNRLWQWHFGRGLVRTSNNFGLTGDKPTHPELLEWLAAEFIKRGWSLKEMHRIMLLSNTYQMSSSNNEQAYAKDPTNDLYWRFDMRRLRAEEIRDSILAANGTLDTTKLFGPSIYPKIPAEVLAGQSRPGHNWPTSSDQDSRRRSIYIHIKRSLAVPMLAAFDVAESDFTCPVRFATTQPTQALGMLNSEFTNEQAKLFAEHVRQSAGEKLEDQITFALTQVSQRPPSQSEVQRGLDLIDSLKTEHQQSAEDALKNFCLLALNLNEFMYLD